LKTVARYRQISLDEVVMEACLASTEPYLWETAYVAWRREHPQTPIQEFGIDGKPLFFSAEGQP
jgi:hypothetical protein